MRSTGDPNSHRVSSALLCALFHIFILIYMDMYIYSHVHIFTYIYIYIYMHVYACVHTHIQIHECIIKFTAIYICECIPPCIFVLCQHRRPRNEPGRIVAACIAKRPLLGHHTPKTRRSGSMHWIRYTYIHMYVYIHVYMYTHTGMYTQA